MNEYLNATCSICGKKYHISNGHTSDQEAKEQLQSCDLSQLDTFSPHIKAVIEKLLHI